MADLVTLQAQLVEAEGALHQLLIGRRTASISYDGKSVTYTQATINELRNYIAELRRQIADLQGMPRRRGPFHLGF
ncbi:MAG: phage head-tail joining protein [Pseudolabrys sp.]